MTGLNIQKRIYVQIEDGAQAYFVGDWNRILNGSRISRQTYENITSGWKWYDQYPLERENPLGYAFAA